MEFRYSTEQEDFRASLRAFLLNHAPLERVRAVSTEGGHDQRLWRRLCAELDLPGLHVPAQYGGASATLTETAIAFLELGRVLTPVPLATTTFAIEAILRMGDDEQCLRLLPGLLSGEQIGAFAAIGPKASDPSAATVWSDSSGGGTQLTGECAPIMHGHVADLFVVPALAGGDITLHVVAADAVGAAVTRLPSFDATRPVARLELAQTPAEALTAGSPDDLERVLDIARILLAAEMLGGAEACLALAVEHAMSRRQFDRPIGSFQAVKHLCADMMIEIDATQAAVMYAAMSADDRAELQITAPLAKAQAADTYLLCAGSAMQIHGGIGFTWEHDLHLYFRRARTSEALLGGSTRQRELLADRARL